MENYCIPDELWPEYLTRREGWMNHAKPHRYAHLTEDGEWFGKVQVEYIRSLNEGQRQRMWMAGRGHIAAIREQFGAAA